MLQNYEENMLKHRDNKRHVEWSLEATGGILQRRFPRSHIYIVKPSSMYLHTFSSFKNFVESNSVGCPTHSSGQGSWQHLMIIIKNAGLQISKQTDRFDSSSQCPAIQPSESHPFEIVGFSKGCVVLNQLLYDLGDARRDTETRLFVSRLQKMHWLDGGHEGGSNTWITKGDILRQLLDTNIKICIHVTPYQIKDQMRLWIGKEKRKFVETLRKLNVDVEDTVHFADQERSLDNHFKVLKCF